MGLGFEAYSGIGGVLTLFMGFCGRWGIGFGLKELDIVLVLKIFL